METFAKESLRRLAQTLNSHTESNFSDRSLHRWFFKSDSDEIKTIHSDLNVLMVDGTGYKKFVTKKKLFEHNLMLEKLGKALVQISKRGEVKILTCIKVDNTLVPLGAMTSEAWKTIEKFISNSNSQNKKVAKKLTNILLSLAEIGLNLDLQNLTHHKQRRL
jgi:hypothetical protein